MLRRSLIAATLLLTACGPTATTSSTSTGPDIKLYAMDCGHAAFADLDMFADDGSMKGKSRTLIVPCYLIRHPSGDLIWDTGFTDAIHGMANGLELPSMGAHITEPTTLAAQLQQLNLTPADIEFVSFSHGHGDHVGNGNMFAHSTWIVDPDERTYMFRREARADAQSFGFYNQLENATTRTIDGDGDFDVFGDGSVTIIQAPGHTPGHTILRVNLRNAGTVLLTGDMWHLSESREHRLVPRFNTDRAQTLASMDKVEALVAATHARVVRQHVQEDFDALPHFPQTLD